MQSSEILETAMYARHMFESKSVSRFELAMLYQNYNPIGDIDAFINRAESLFPNLNCGLASVFLQDRLDGKIVNGNYAGEPHTFLLIDQTTIVDITADQYGGPRIYVGPIKEPWSLE